MIDWILFELERKKTWGMPTLCYDGEWQLVERKYPFDTASESREILIGETRSSC